MVFLGVTIPATAARAMRRKAVRRQRPRVPEKTAPVRAKAAGSGWNLKKNNENLMLNASKWFKLDLTHHSPELFT